MKIVDITKYELVMKNKKPVKNTYKDKKTGEIVKIDYRNGKFRML